MNVATLVFVHELKQTLVLAPHRRLSFISAFLIIQTLQLKTMKVNKQSTFFIT